MTIERNDPAIANEISTIVRNARALNELFRDLDIDNLWKAASAINVASADIVRRIVKTLP